MEMRNKNVLITGASSGIGRALAIEFANQGANLCLVARRLDRLQALAKELPSTRPEIQIECVVADVTQGELLSKGVCEAFQKLGTLDVVVANAGFGVSGTVQSLSVDDFRRQLETNLFGVIHTFKCTSEALIKNKGVFAVVGSVNGYVALPGNSAYAMSKFAIRALCQSLYHEMRPLGVAVTHIAPGFIETEIRQIDNFGVHHPLARDPVPAWLVLKTDKAARQIVRGVMARKREVVVTSHGKLIRFLSLYFSWAVDGVISAFGIQGKLARSSK